MHIVFSIGKSNYPVSLKSFEDMLVNQSIIEDIPTHFSSDHCQSSFLDLRNSLQQATTPSNLIQNISRPQET